MSPVADKRETFQIDCILTSFSPSFLSSNCKDVICSMQLSAKKTIQQMDNFAQMNLNTIWVNKGKNEKGIVSCL